MVIKRPKLSEKVKFYRKEKKILATVDEKNYYEIPEAVAAIMGLMNGKRTVFEITREITGDRAKAKELEDSVNPVIEKLVLAGIAELV